MPTTRKWFCTLFDQNYLIKGLAMYESLERQGDNFCLYVLCMDEVTHDVLNALGLEHIKLIRLMDFETDQLTKLKRERSVAEYCWTCTPSLLSYVFEVNGEIDFLTYLDADLLFFDSVAPLFDESQAASSVIIEHRFSKGFEASEINGKYNVQWVGFRRDENGKATLSWWRDQCLEWCYNRAEPGRFGDQKYLDYWQTKFQGVHVLQNIGAGVGPWNFANYQVTTRHDRIMIDASPLIFYHFHGYRMYDDGGFTAMPSAYMNSVAIPYAIYEPYRHALWNALRKIRTVLPNFVEGTVKTSQFIHEPRAYKIGSYTKASFKRGIFYRIYLKILGKAAASKY